MKNGSDIVAKAGTITGTTVGVLGLYGSAVVNLTVGDYIELRVEQNSGSDLDMYKRIEDAALTVAYLGA